MTLVTSPRSQDFDPALNRARQTLYRFIALALLDPRRGSWERLQELRKGPLVHGAAQWMRECAEACPSSLGLGEKPLTALDPTLVFERLPTSPADHNERYERTFGLLASGGCAPYEMEYVPAKHTFQRAQSLADISGFYRAFGLKPADVLKERQDHIVLELEFMASLIGLERRAAESSHTKEHECVSICRDAQSRFLREHLAWWAPAFARLLSKEDPSGFYEAVGIFLSALMPAERALLDVPPFLGQAQPSPLERPEECDHCSLAS